MKSLRCFYVIIILLFITGCSSSSLAYDVIDGQKTATISVTDDEQNKLLFYKFSFDDGCSVADALSFSAKQLNIAVVKNGTGKNVYISSIAGLAEFDMGATSGWVYKVNGETMSVSCAKYKLSDNDVIEWFYTLDLGKDVGASK